MVFSKELLDNIKLVWGENSNAVYMCKKGLGEDLGRFLSHEYKNFPDSKPSEHKQILHDIYIMWWEEMKAFYNQDVEALAVYMSENNADGGLKLN